MVEQIPLDAEYSIPVPTPFGNEFHIVTKLERKAWNYSQQEGREADRKERESLQAWRDKLRDLGYIDLGNSSFATKYEARLLQVLSQEGITHIDQIPEHIHLLQQKDTTSLQLFSQMNGVVQSEHVDDFYVAEIKKYLDEGEAIIQKYCRLTDDYFRHIQDIFLRGQVRDLSLFERFEKLKREERKNSIVCQFKFNAHYFFEDYNKVALDEKAWIDTHSMKSVMAGLRCHWCDLQDLDCEKYPFLQKIEESYKRDVKQDILSSSYQYLTGLSSEHNDLFSQLSSEEQLFVMQSTHLSETRWKEMTQAERNQVVGFFVREEGKLLPLTDIDQQKIKNWEKYRRKYNGFHSSDMQNLLHIDTELQNRWQFGSKKEIIQNFSSFFDDLSLSKLSDFFSKKVLRIEQYSINLYLFKIPGLLSQIALYQEDFDCDVSVEEIKKKIIENFTDLYRLIVDKIKNNETIEYNSNRRNPDPECIFSDMVGYLKAIATLLKELDASVSTTLPPVDEITTYSKQYIDHFLLQKVKSKYPDLDMGSFAQLTTEERDSIEETLIEKLSKNYLHLQWSCVKSAGGGPNIMENGCDPIVGRQGLEDVLLQLGLIRPLDKIFASTTKKNNSVRISTSATREERQTESYRKDKEKFFVFQRKVVKKCIDQIHSELLHLQTFDRHKISIIGNMKDDYVAYFGDEKDITIDWESISAVYFASLKNSLANHFIAIKRLFLSPKSKRENYIAPYVQLRKIDREIHSFLRRAFPECSLHLGVGEEGVLFAKNKAYIDQYGPAYVDHLTFSNFDIEKLLEIIPKNMNTYFKEIFDKISKIKPEILRLCVNYWLFENGTVGGRLQRIVYEKILQHSGKDALSPQEQMSYAINFLSEELSNIVWEDFSRNILDGTYVFPFDKDLVISMVQKFLKQWQLGLGNKLGEKKLPKIIE